ncbi:MAG: RagB/SusD family nutrient uptake outer membrane protein [Bacteroidales bacterium]|nr:RagB/SusD family nutrient uptake outer membrane protein [Bacteroidales bacterium]
MKKIIILLIISFTLFNCSDVLDITPPGKLTAVSAYNTSEDAIMLVTGCYDIMGETWAIEFPWMSGDMSAGDAWKGGDSPGDQFELDDMAYFTSDASNKFNWYRWRAYWMGIYRCNTALKYIPEIEMNNDLQNRLLAEVRFLRAFYYFELMKNYKELPILTEPTSLTDLSSPRAPIKELCEDLLEPELIAVAQMLPQKSEYSTADAGRATRGAALGLLAKLYLFEGSWERSYILDGAFDAEAKFRLAAETAKTVIDEGEYELEEDFWKTFDVDNPNGIESIFETQNSSDQTYSEGSSLPTFTRSRNDLGWGFFMPSQHLINAFEPGDPRLEKTVVQDGDTIVIIENGDTIDYKPDYMVTIARPGTMAFKYYVPEVKRPVGNEYEQSNYNVKIMRYADLLLMYAEACNEIQDTDEALWALEKVRNRARQMSDDPSQVLPEITTTDQAELRLLIEHERRVELATEFHRFYDIVRTGRAPEIIASIYEYNNSGDENNEKDGDAWGALFEQNKNEFFGIPQTDIDATGWTQNNGY